MKKLTIFLLSVAIVLPLKALPERYRDDQGRIKELIIDTERFTLMATRSE